MFFDGFTWCVECNTITDNLQVGFIMYPECTAMTHLLREGDTLYLVGVTVGCSHQRHDRCIHVHLPHTNPVVLVTNK